MVRSPDKAASSPAAAAALTADLGFQSNNHERSLFKRTHPHLESNADRSKSADRGGHSRGGGRGLYHGRRKGFQLKGRSMVYFCVLLALFGLALAPMVLQSTIGRVLRQGRSERGIARWLRERNGGGGSVRPLRFVMRELDGAGRLDRLRMEARVAVRPPRLALILGNTRKNPESLMLFTVVKNLQLLGYMFQLYAMEDGNARTMWEQLGGQMLILNPERFNHLDWSIYEGVIAHSIEAKEAVSSLVQEPFCPVPLIWIIQEDVLANRLTYYNEMGWRHLISHWQSAFSRADMIVFSDYSLPMLYSVVDKGNFFVIPGSPVDVWAAESYARTHSKYNMRKSRAYGSDDLLVLVAGSSLFFNEILWDYAVVRTIGPLLVKYANKKDGGGSVKFIFFCRNSTDDCGNDLQEVAAHLRLGPDSMRHYGLNSDVNGVLLMSDIFLYVSFQDEQGFPSLLARAMTFGIPIVAPNLRIVKNYVVDGVHGMIYDKKNQDDLLRAFSLLVSRDRKLSKFAVAVGSTGKRLAENMLASECIKGYANLLEYLLDFPSYVSLPRPFSPIQQQSWEWNFFREKMAQRNGDSFGDDEYNAETKRTSVVYSLENDLNSIQDSGNLSDSMGRKIEQEIFTTKDWEVLKEVEKLEEMERLEVHQLEDRMDKDPGNWDEIYRNARKSEKLKFEANERDDGELERTGQPICIYEIYYGAGAWPFLHHGSLYRGLSLSTRSTRLSSNDIDAVTRLPLLSDFRYRDLLCEIGGMFAIANKVDEIHKRPWIGFQSWRASGRKVSLSVKAEGILEKIIEREARGDVMYFWKCLEIDTGLSTNNELLTFWSLCDILNGGQCRNAFEIAFRHMYGLASSVDALPPMPGDGGHWSALHSWVMPTPSFLEFVMFARIFADSLNTLHGNTNITTGCMLGFSQLERKHCYCRLLELLVNVWAYHSARRMVYIDPRTGLFEEQHPVDRRKGMMWVKYFNFTLLKRMDEDLAEAADDGDFQSDTWLWPLTGEVHWQGIYEREREQRYRNKMDKKKKTKEKLLERMKYGYKQKSLGRK
ncbi:hypothetical protein AKJ16_DCAP14950 [Drosera capensis]